MQQSAYTSPSTQDKELKKMQLAFDKPAKPAHNMTNVTQLLQEEPATPLGQSSGSSKLLHVHPLKLLVGQNTPSSQSCGRETLGETFSMAYPVS